MPIRLPDDSHRLSIIGRTGSGKTFVAAWHLSRRHFNVNPWIIFDFKRDKLLAKLGATPVEMKDALPNKPGLYIVRPMPHECEDGTLEDYLWKIWSKENTGVYIDEGYMIGKNNGAFRALLTQGRSKRIPMIVLSQRPVELDRFVFSESDFFSVMKLTDARDRKTVQSFVPFDMETPLPEFHSMWHDVGQGQAYLLRPVPDEATLLARFRKRIGPKRKAL
jgi:hypothetical protein